MIDFENLVEECLNELPALPLKNISVEIEPIELKKSGNQTIVAECHKSMVSGVQFPNRIILYKQAFAQLPRQHLKEEIKNAIRHELRHVAGYTHEEMDTLDELARKKNETFN